MSSQALHHLVYQSVATTPMTEPELEMLLTQSRAWNEAHGLTGLLLYSNGNIMQVLEGTQEEVHYIFSRIELDQRHFGVTKLSDGPIHGRNFFQWSMGFRAVNPEAFGQLAGYQDPENPAAHLATYSENDNLSLYGLLCSFSRQDEVYW
ncbi:BLUF domain-containing protein [Hymenobacter sp. HSC-4F20]|uniref:BLUF domain-containing protein n=1 Tax=Hymenobacter sp. HSC-4F20 TaxID=2864135 RepID=UPI001C7393E2|nr:BLUF domain-containing protein [Hymenobacter sp. HSC-4F20]MBX0290189.1 BLUF domain-containing protein [Hymenobacter sp. HSC-4F20]